MENPVGERLRAIRKKKGLTLATVSSLTNLPVSTLSKVENGQATLTYDRMLDLVKGLEISIEDLIGNQTEQIPRGGRAFGPSPSDPVIATGNYEYTYLCSELAHRKMVPMIGKVLVNSIETFGPLVSHSGEEFSYVLSGEIWFHSAHYRPALMKQGQSIYFDANMGHAYINAGSEPALILCVCTAPESELFNGIEPI